MEAIWKIEVEYFSAFVMIDHQGNDFYVQLMEAKPATLIR